MARTDVNHDTKKEELIKIALDLFVNFGYENVTISKIMKEGNISKGALYHYFDSKEEILDCTIKYLLSQDEAIINKSMDSFKTSTEKIIRSFLLSFDVNRHETTPSKEIRNFYEYEQNSKASIFIYRAVDLSKKKTLDFYEQIIIDGIKGGEFKTDCPREVAELLVSCMGAVLKNTSNIQDKKQVENKVKWLVDIVNFSLSVKEGQFDKLYDLILEVHYE